MAIHTSIAEDKIIKDAENVGGTIVIGLLEIIERLDGELDMERTDAADLRAEVRMLQAEIENGES